MIALLRYAILKTWREQLAIGLLLAPVVMLALPLLAMALNNLRLGQPAYPLSFDPRLGPGGTAAMIGEVVLLICGMVGGVASFRVFAREIAAKGLGFFYLALPPRTVATAAAVYGVLIGMGSWLVAMSVVSVLTASFPAEAGRQFLIALISSAVCSTLGSVMVRISTDATMLVPVYVAGAALGMTLLESGTPIAFALSIAAVLLMMVIAQILWRRRCAV